MTSRCGLLALICLCACARPARKSDGSELGDAADVIDTYLLAFQPAIAAGEGRADETLWTQANERGGVRYLPFVHDVMDHAFGFDYARPQIALGAGEPGNLRLVHDPAIGQRLLLSLRMGIRDALKNDDIASLRWRLRRFFTLHEEFKPAHAGRCYPHGHAISETEGDEHISPVECIEAALTVRIRALRSEILAGPSLTSELALPVKPLPDCNCYWDRECPATASCNYTLASGNAPAGTKEDTCRLKGKLDGLCGMCMKPGQPGATVSDPSDCCSNTTVKTLPQETTRVSVVSACTVGDTYTGPAGTRVADAECTVTSCTRRADGWFDEVASCKSELYQCNACGLPGQAGCTKDSDCCTDTFNYEGSQLVCRSTMLNMPKTCTYVACTKLNETCGAASVPACCPGAECVMGRCAEKKFPSEELVTPPAAGTP